jgi:hypothetical protein
MKRVYVAGAYGASTVNDVMGNMRRGLQLSAEVLRHGFAVYSPWTDCLLHFHQEFTIEECYSYSMPWLEVSDAVVVVEKNRETSRGTQSEIKRASELGIPVFFSKEELFAWQERTATNGRN